MTKNERLNLLIVLYATFKKEVDDMNETEGLTTFSELEQITQSVIIQNLNERHIEA